ncbi:hypothetical protein AMAG_20001 [Allomyces macrogynus ATCC 38327]|uniref:Uncharacterized protein n=1 Tax=Allomyces macrogynus (strain ATCC 38327) TaxID=578462 RepID=A0A0L0T4G6_ALLM3|nr:hypothetical protein AMAG_20001 [Allomyces macrogynus ATCC 38327]|eukprot:KNE69596.1 hypothetical protein AMAG_20001 [Allomyces macrogynus ATCC 38327]
MKLTRHEPVFSKTPEEWAPETKGEIELNTCQVFGKYIRQFVLNLMGHGICPSMRVHKTTKSVIKHIRTMYGLKREDEYEPWRDQSECGAVKRNWYW